MLYKIEMKYIYGWDDASWTEEDDDGERPLQFQYVHDAQSAIDEYLADVNSAVAAGDMDVDDSPSNFRIATVNARN